MIKKAIHQTLMHTMLLLVAAVSFSSQASSASVTNEKVINEKFTSEKFTIEKLQSIKKHNLGQQWLLVLWSLDCPPCFKELALIAKLDQQHKDIKVVFINTDDNDELNEQRNEVIRQFKLTAFPNWHFAQDQADKLRFQIDPSWYGELPRSYFVNQQGQLYGKSGLLAEQQVISWLVGDPLLANKSK